MNYVGNYKDQWFAALGNEDIEKVEELLNKGMSIDCKRSNDDTAITIAIKKGNAELLRTLIKKGANMEMKNSKGETPLIFALKNHEVKNRTNIAKCLIENGANVNARTHGGNAPVIEAAANGELEIVELLFAKGANLNVFSNIGGVKHTALMRSAKKGHKKIVEFLLANGADVNMKIRLPSGPILSAPGLASQEGHLEIVKLFLEYGLDETTRREIAIQQMLRDCPIPSILEMTLSYGIGDIDSPDSDGITLFMLAMNQQNIETIALLLKNGANPSLKVNKENKSIISKNRKDDTGLSIYFSETNKPNPKIITLVIQYLVKNFNSFFNSESTNKRIEDDLNSYLEYDKKLFEILKNNPEKMKIWRECEQKFLTIQRIEIQHYVDINKPKKNEGENEYKKPGMIKNEMIFER